MAHDRILFIGDSSSWSVKASECAKELFGDVQSVLWDYGDPYPSGVQNFHGDMILSFKSDLILTNDLLSQAKCAINFHPAPPKYRGIGGYEYAIRNHDPQFGVTCHHIVEKIDFGPIIKVIVFPIPADATASSLKEISATYCLKLFQEIVSLLMHGGNLPVSEETWGDRLYTRAALDQLDVAGVGFSKRF